MSNSTYLVLLVDCNVVVHPSFYRQAFVIKRIYFAFGSDCEALLGGIKKSSPPLGVWLLQKTTQFGPEIKRKDLELEHSENIEIY